MSVITCKNISKLSRKNTVETHMGLVRKCAWNYYKKYPHKRQVITIDDCIHYGVFGLISAHDKYDSTKGTKFSTYAYPWIHSTIRRNFLNNKYTIRVPEAKASRALPCFSIGDKDDYMIDGSFEEDIYHQVEREYITKEINKLGKDEARVIFELYGFNGAIPLIKDLAKDMGISPTKVYNLHVDALRELRDGPLGINGLIDLTKYQGRRVFDASSGDFVDN